jgi:hypothetical protein
MHGVVGSGASVHYSGPTVIRSVTCALRERAKEVSKLWLSGVTVSGSGMHAIEIAMLASEEWLILNLACRVSLACVGGARHNSDLGILCTDSAAGLEEPYLFSRRDATVTSRLAMLAGQ